MSFICIATKLTFSLSLFLSRVSSRTLKRDFHGPPQVPYSAHRPLCLSVEIKPHSLCATAARNAISPRIPSSQIRPLGLYLSSSAGLVSTDPGGLLQRWQSLCTELQPAHLPERPRGYHAAVRVQTNLWHQAGEYQSAHHMLPAGTDCNGLKFQLFYWSASPFEQQMKMFLIIHDDLTFSAFMFGVIHDDVPSKLQTDMKLFSGVTLYISTVVKEIDRHGTHRSY